MPTNLTNPSPSSFFRRSRDYFALILLSSAISVGALVFYYHQGTLLLYGDAVAHINIARRVFDSRTPGLFQLGTVWLPLPHLLDIPFIANDWFWRTGLGGSIPSMLAYVMATLGVFRLVRGLASRASAWIAAVIFALNPNLIYMQATAMTEALYLALFVWTVVFFSEFARTAGPDPERAAKSLRNCAFTLSPAMLVRYDAWFLAAVVVTAASGLIVKMRVSPLRGSTSFRPSTQGSRPGLTYAAPPALGRREGRVLSREVTNLAALAALTAGLWLAYNYARWGNALEFVNGPYSAHAIQQQTRTSTMPSYPGENSPRTAALYFLKLTRLNLGQGFAEHLLLTIAVVALLCALYFSRQFLPWALLWTPVLFYVLCIAWGSVPIYFPDWWPYSYYNVRYGLQLLPAVAVFVALAYEFLHTVLKGHGSQPCRQDVPHARGLSRWPAFAVLIVVATSYVTLWRQTPICLREAQANGRARLEFDHRLAAELKKLPTASTLLMDCSAHPGAVQAAGIPFRRVLRESNPPYWEAALSEPSLAADYIVAIEGDDVDRAVRRSPQRLQPVVTVGTPPGPKATIYRSMHY
jgi:hypothetical protein